MACLALGFAGIGALSDAELVRSLRYGISHDGRPLVPIMAFAELSDRDLEAIVSYLRTLPADPTPAPASDLSWIGRLACSGRGASVPPAETPG